MSLPSTLLRVLSVYTLKVAGTVVRLGDLVLERGVIWAPADVLIMSHSNKHIGPVCIYMKLSYRRETALKPV